MPEGLVREETAALFFRDQLSTAMDHQKVATSAFTECYLVHLLAGFARGERLPGREPGFDETPLAILYARALQASRFERAVLLRATADTALFVSGFFAESLPGGGGDIRYYASLGGRAYARLARSTGPRTRRAAPSSTSWPARFLRVRGRARGDRREDPAEDTRLRGPALRALGGDGQPARRRAAGGGGHHAGRPLRERTPLSGPPDSARDRLGQLAVDVQRRLEAFYALDPEAPVTDYLVAPGEAAHLPGGGSRTLVAQEGDEVSVGVVLDEATRRAPREVRPARAARLLEPGRLLHADRGGQPLPVPPLPGAQRAAR